MIRLLKLKRWTSDLEIYVKEDSLDFRPIFNDIDSVLVELENKYSNFNVHTSYPSRIRIEWDKSKDLNEIKKLIESDYIFLYCLECNKLSIDEIMKFINYNKDNIDMTGILKGYAIQRIYQVLIKYSKSFLINFGGDILGYHVDEKIKIEVHKDLKTSTQYLGSGNFVHFSSGNYSEDRGEHIIGAEKYIKGTTAVSKELMPIRADYFATLSMTDASLDDDIINITRYDEDGNFL